MRLRFASSFLLALALSSSWAVAAGTDATKPAASATPAPAKSADQAEQENARQYAKCIALAKDKPEEGWENALAWSSLGGGEPARHCGAIALIGLKQYGEAATRLEALAKESHRDETIRAGMLAQAGQAWLLAKQPERAYAAQTAALKLVPGASDLLIDRAESLAEAKNYKDAVADLDQALKAAPGRVDALTFRASAKRYLDDLAGAQADIARALSLDPTYVDAWLESGDIKRLSGQNDGARADWMKVLNMAPNSPAADMARRNIELLDLKSR